MTTTYNLLTMIDNRMSAFEPIVAPTEAEAIAFASGMLRERTKGHLPMFAALKVRWGLDTGERNIADVTMATGPVVGTFDVVTRGGEMRIVWTVP